MNADLIEKTAIQSLRQTCDRLRVRIVAPYVLSDTKLSAYCAAYLPDLGGPNGMVIGFVHPPDFMPESYLKALAEAQMIYVSLVNPKGWLVPDERAFMDAAYDWGYFGKDAERPEWLLNRS